jgi:hypothetical protein
MDEEFPNPYGVLDPEMRGHIERKGETYVAACRESFFASGCDRDHPYHGAFTRQIASPPQVTLCPMEQRS